MTQYSPNKKNSHAAILTKGKFIAGREISYLNGCSQAKVASARDMPSIGKARRLRYILRRHA